MKHINKVIRRDKSYYKAIQHDKGYYKAIQDDKGYYKAIQRDKGNYKAIQHDKGYYKAIQRDKGYYKTIYRDKGCYKAIQRDKGYHKAIQRDKGYYKAIQRDKGYYTLFNVQDTKLGIFDTLKPNEKYIHPLRLTVPNIQQLKCIALCHQPFDSLLTYLFNNNLHIATKLSQCLLSASASVNIKKCNLKHVYIQAY